MKRIVIILALATILSGPLFAIDETNPVIIAVRSFIDEQKYETAFGHLKENAEGVNPSDLAVMQTNILLEYHVQSINHQMFALTDIPQNASLDDYRGGEGSYNLQLIKPDEMLAAAIEQDEGNGELYFWLGQFYFEVLQIYGENWLKSEDALLSLSIDNYKKALELGFQDKRLFGNLGQAELRKGNYEPARVYLEQAIALDSSAAGNHHNLAIAYLNLENYSVALEHADSAIELYQDSFFRADSYYLAAMICIRDGQYPAAINYLKEGKELRPRQYRFHEQLMGLSLYLGDQETAMSNALSYFALYPKNPTVLSRIVNVYNSYENLAGAEKILENLLANYEDTETRGNIFFHKALVSDGFDKTEQALQELRAAEDYFQQVFTEDHQVFEQIYQIRQRMVE